MPVQISDRSAEPLTLAIKILTACGGDREHAILAKMVRICIVRYTNIVTVRGRRTHKISRSWRLYPPSLPEKLVATKPSNSSCTFITFRNLDVRRLLVSGHISCGLRRHGHHPQCPACSLLRSDTKAKYSD